MAERVAEEQLKPMAQKVADNAEPMAKDATAQYIRQPAKQLAEQVSEWSSQCPMVFKEGAVRAALCLPASWVFSRCSRALRSCARSAFCHKRSQGAAGAEG